MVAESPLRIGIAGLGTVGAAVVRLIDAHGAALAQQAGRPVEIAAVAARDRARDRGIDLSAVRWFTDPVEMALAPGVDAVVELIGGDSGPAEATVRAALGAGRPVVTANKALIARHGMELAALTEGRGAGLHFEAAVAGGIPVIRTLREALAGTAIQRVYGILNGTCNYILTRMEAENLPFETCLAEAQRLGYAEADPTFDIEGYDTAHKLAILTSLAFGTRLAAEAIYTEGISAITPADIAAADELGYRIKLVGVARRTATGVEQRVHPAMVPKASAVARVDGVLNAVAIDADFLGEIVLAGPGAGGGATASAVVADIADVARGVRAHPFGRPVAALEPYVEAEIEAHRGGYYLRLDIHDRPGAFAAIAARMAEHGISLESIVQRRRAPRTALAATAEPDAPQPVALITYETTEAEIAAALSAIEADGHIAARPRLIRIEEL